MFKHKKPAGLLAMVALAGLLLTACGGTAASPTPDAQAIFTAAAQTVQAQLSQTAAAQPTATQTSQPTATTAPTNTPASLSSTMAAALPGPGTAIAGTPGLPGLPGAGTPKPAVLPSPTIARAPSGDKAEWVRNDPADNTTMDPNVKFDIVWFVKNTGTTTWTKDYKLRYYVGDRFADRNEFKFLEEVAPGQTGRLVADATTPSTRGTYKTTFVLTNKDGVNFFVVDLTIVVGSSAEATAVAGATHTPTTLDWMCSDADRSKIQGGGCDTHCPAVYDSWLAEGKKCYILGVEYVK